MAACVQVDPAWEGTGPNPTDRGKSGWKWSVATDTVGVPIGWVTDGANRNDSVLLEPTLQAVAGHGLLTDVQTLHLDKGYDSHLTIERCHSAGVTDIVCAKKRKDEPKVIKKRRRRAEPKTTKPSTGELPKPSTGELPKPSKGEARTKEIHTLGLRWPVERTNSWFSNFGHLRRNTDRFTAQRHGQIALAVTLILTVKLIKWAKRWND